MNSSEGIPFLENNEFLKSLSSDNQGNKQYLLASSQFNALKKIDFRYRKK